ncbi:MAG: SAM-dependent chlorinase/fluorinase [Acidimicrobiales bacterium]|nr:SAM-dependent chlorinase/fluorinase [Acidimicrobiales bacterium]
MSYDTISFLSDYGHDDEFVGVVHSVIRSLAPTTRVIDITHNIAPHDVRAGALTLARSAQYLAPGVVLAVVDPGVGTSRRPIAVEVGEGASVLVGPDNGLLAPTVALCGGATRAVELSAPDYRLPAPGATFDGRDVFGPAAAHLCAGVALEELGPAIDPGALVPGMMPVARDEGDTIVAEVLWVDRFGNCQLNVDPDDIERFGEDVSLRFADSVRSATVATAYGELGPGVVGLVVDSYGLLSVSLARRSAALELGLHVGDEVVLAPSSVDGRSVTTSVQLGRRPSPAGADGAAAGGREAEG